MVFDLKHYRKATCDRCGRDVYTVGEAHNVPTGWEHLSSDNLICSECVATIKIQPVSLLTREAKTLGIKPLELVELILKPSEQ